MIDYRDLAADEYGAGSCVAETKDGFRILRMVPGFSIEGPGRFRAYANGWSEAVAMIRVEREASRAIRRA